MIKKTPVPTEDVLAKLTHEKRQSFVEDYAMFLDRWRLDSSPELAAVYYNARAHRIAGLAVRDAKAHMEYTLLLGLSRINYDEALKSINNLIDQEI